MLLHKYMEDSFIDLAVHPNVLGKATPFSFVFLFDFPNYRD